MGQRLGDLAHAVRAEVERDHAVARADARLGSDRGGVDELVGLVARVRLACRVGRMLDVMGGDAVDQQRARPLRALRAVVAVHRVIAPDDRAHARAVPRRHALQVAGARGGRRVAPVGERVHDQVGHPQRAAEGDERLQVLDRGVHAAVGDQPDQVHALAGLHGPAQHLVVDLVAEQRLVDAQQVLLDDGARAEVQVAHLGVAHLTGAGRRRGRWCAAGRAGSAPTGRP